MITQRKYQSTLLAAVLAALAGSASAMSPNVPTPAAQDGPGGADIAQAAGTCAKPPADFVPILEAMNNASTYGHPDLFGEFAGMQRYFRCDYKGAMKYFKIASRYADKLSQFTVGLMYLNGEGVARDPVTACAWLDLAAERKFPKYETVRNEVCGTLTKEQNGQAAATLAKLLPEFGDEVAQRRMATALRVIKNSEFTGSRTGFDFGRQTWGKTIGSMRGVGMETFGVSLADCGKPTVVYGGMPVPLKNCASSEFWSPWFWNPKVYFTMRDSTGGKVVVGALKELHDAPPADTKQKK